MSSIDYVGCMQNNAVPTAEMVVDDLMRRRLRAIRAFLDFRMRCVHCPIAAFHSVDEACKEHDVDVDMFLTKVLGTAMA